MEDLCSIIDKHNIFERSRIELWALKAKCTNHIIILWLFLNQISNLCLLLEANQKNLNFKLWNLVFWKPHKGKYSTCMCLWWVLMGSLTKICGVAMPQLHYLIIKCYSYYNATVRHLKNHCDGTIPANTTLECKTQELNGLFSPQEWK